MVEFRRSLAASFLFKGLLFVAQQLEAEVPAFTSPFPENYRSGKRRPCPAGFQGRCVVALCTLPIQHCSRAPVATCPAASAGLPAGRPARR